MIVSAALSVALIVLGLVMLVVAVTRKSGEDAGSWAAPAVFALSIGSLVLAISTSVWRLGL